MNDHVIPAWMLAALFALFLFLQSCGGGGGGGGGGAPPGSGGGGGGTGEMAVTIQWPAPGPLMASMDAAPGAVSPMALPAGVVTLRIQVTSAAAGVDTTVDFAAAGGSGTVKALPVATDYEVVAGGLDGVGDRIYEGRAANVVVAVATTTSVPISMVGLGAVTIDWSQPSGALDLTLGGTGFVTHHNAAWGNGHDSAYGLVIDGQGNIVTSGISNESLGINEMAVWRYRDDGLLDPGFDSIGYVTPASPLGATVQVFDYGFAVKMDAQGRILVAGQVRSTLIGSDLAVLRLLPNGQIDTGFGVGGWVTQHNTGGSAPTSGQDLAIDGQGRLVVVGYGRTPSGDRSVVWRILADGSFDTSFNTVGWAVIDLTGQTSYFRSVAIDAVGKIVVTGSRSNGADNDLLIVRLHEDGSLDTSLANSGWVVQHNTAGGNGEDSGSGIAIDNDGRIYVAGASENALNQDLVLWRFNPDGSLDTSFNSTGFALFNGPADAHDAGFGLALDASGRIVVAGYSQYSSATNQDMLLLRFNSDGTLDSTFGTNGAVTHDGAAGNSDWANRVVIDPLGRIVAAGTSHNGTDNDMAVWRFLP